jgi:hypothetical protein
MGIYPDLICDQHVGPLIAGLGAAAAALR